MRVRHSYDALSATDNAPFGAAVNPLVNAQTLASSRTFSIPDHATKGYAYLILYVYYTHSNNGNLVISFTSAHPDAPSTNCGMRTAVLSGGNSTLNAPASITEPVTGDVDFVYPIKILGMTNLIGTVSHSAGDANDIVTIRGSLVTE